MAMGPILGPGRRGRRTPMAEINVTPMVDVMLVLLIIFMVTAPLLADRRPGRPAREQGGGARAGSASRWRSRSTRSGAVFVDDTPVPTDALGAAAAPDRRARSREQGGPRIFLRADQRLDYGRVMQVMGEINRAGLRRVALVSTAQRERALMDRAEASRLRRRRRRPCRLARRAGASASARPRPAAARAGRWRSPSSRMSALTSAAPQPSAAPRGAGRGAARGRPSRRRCRAGAVTADAGARAAPARAEPRRAERAQRARRPPPAGAPGAGRRAHAPARCSATRS